MRSSRLIGFGLSVLTAVPVALMVWFVTETPNPIGPQHETLYSVGRNDRPAVTVPAVALRPAEARPASLRKTVPVAEPVRAGGLQRVEPEGHAGVGNVANKTAAVSATSVAVYSPPATKLLVNVETPVTGGESAKVCTPEACGSEPNLGTALHWVADTKEAAKLAKQQGKLVFLIQVSGNFAREEFT